MTSFPRAMNRRIISINALLRWLLPILLIYALIAVTVLLSSERVQTALRAVSPAVLIGFLMIVLASYCLRALRWHGLSYANHLPTSLGGAMKIYFGGFPMVMSPARVGEIWRAWVLNERYHIPYRRGLSLVFCDRLLDLSALLLFAALGIVSTNDFYFLAALIACVAAFFLVIILPLRPHWIMSSVKFLYQLCGKRFSRQFAALISIARYVGHSLRWRLYVPMLLLSILAWSVEASALAYLANSMGAQLLVVEAVSLLGVSNIIGVLFLLPGGVGGQEAAMIFLLTEAGNAPLLAVAVIVVARTGTIFFSSLLGLPFFIHLSRQSNA